MDAESKFVPVDSKIGLTFAAYLYSEKLGFPFVEEPEQQAATPTIYHPFKWPGIRTNPISPPSSEADVFIEIFTALLP